MKTIRLNVEGLPEPVVEGQAKEGERTPIELLVRSGKVIGPLTREEIYSDRLDRLGFPRRRAGRPKP